MSLFRRRRKEAPPFPAAPGTAPSTAPPALKLPAAARAAAHIGELWETLNAIAREDGLEGKTAVEHYNLSAEGKKDVERWLQIYLLRVLPGHRASLPAHHPRHRGYCLIPRVWPEGLRWQAVNEQTLFRAPLPEEPDRASLISALDRYLDRRGAGTADPPDRRGT